MHNQAATNTPPPTPATSAHPPPATPSPPRARHLRRFRLRLRLHQTLHPREIDLEHRPLAQLTVNRNVTPARLHNPMTRRQPQARAFARFLRRKKRLEQPRPHLRRHPAAVVTHRQHHISPRRHVLMQPRIIFVQRHIRRLNRQPAPSFGIASRAFTAKFKITCSICPGSAFHLPRYPPPDSSPTKCPPPATAATSCPSPRCSCSN